MTLPVVAVSALLTVTRAGVGTVLSGAGVVTDIAANVPRRDFASDGSPLGLLIEGAETSYNPNPRWIGGTPGVAPTPGSPPTGGTVGTSPTNTALANATPFNGCTTRYGGNVTIGGVEFATMQLYGNAPGPASGSSQALLNNIPILQAVQQNYLMRAVLLGGSWNNIEFLRVRDQALTQVDLHTRITAINQVVDIPMPVKAAGALTDTSASFLLLVWRAISGPVDVTVGFSSITALRGGRLAQSLIRPAAGALGPYTRPRDDIRWARVDWWNPDRVVEGVNVGCGLMLQFMLQAVTVAGDRGMARLDDLTSSNRTEFYVAAGTNNIMARRVEGGVTLATTLIGTVTPGQAFRLVLSADATSIRAMLSGGDIVTIPVGTVFTVARGFLGSITADDSTPLWGWVYGGLLFPRGLPNDQMGDQADMANSFAALRAAAEEPA
jgi:hypothetical protein